MNQHCSLQKQDIPHRIDVIVYLHNDMPAIKECLQSIVSCSSAYQLVIINDHLDHQITAFLSQFSCLHPCRLIENFDTLGFTRSVNKALQATTAPYVALLDSHVIVTENWLENLLDALNCDDAAGIVTPLLDIEIFQRKEDMVYDLEMAANIVENAFCGGSPEILLEGRPCWMAKRSHLGKVKTATLAAKALVSSREGYIMAGHGPEFSKIIDNIHDLMSSVDLKVLKDKSILFLMPSSGGSGGANCVVDEMLGLRRCGINAKVAVPEIYLNRFLAYYPQAGGCLCAYTEEGNELLDMASSVDIAIAVNHSSVRDLKRMVDHAQKIIPMYYIQDHEVWFYPKHDLKRTTEAAKSYTLVPAMVSFAKTNWLCDLIHAWYGIYVRKITPGLDKNIFNPYPHRSLKAKGPVRISAMVRPQSLIRAPRETMEILKVIKNTYKNRVDIRVFGCTDEELDMMDESRGFHFVNEGELTRPEIGQLLSGCDIFIDASLYQAFGCTGLEAMAVGCAPILPANCGTSEYALDRQNCLLVNTENERDVISAIALLIEDKDLLLHIKDNGIKTGRSYSLRKAVWSQILLFCQCLANVNSIKV